MIYSKLLFSQYSSTAGLNEILFYQTVQAIQSKEASLYLLVLKNPSGSKVCGPVVLWT